MTKPKPRKKDDVEDTSAPSTSTRPPPILEKQEARLPVLRIRRIKPNDVNLEVALESNGDEEEESTLKVGPEGPSPPQLDKCIEDDNVSITSSSTTTTTKDDDKNYRTSRSSQRQKNSATDPKRLIQSIFAKPKKEKSKKRKAAVKSKKSVKPTNQYLRIKLAPAGFGRRQGQTSTSAAAEDEESDNGDDGGIMDVDDVDQSCSDTGGSRRMLRSRGQPGNGEDEDSEEDGDDKRCNEGSSGTRSQEGVGEETNNQDKDSGKKSDDEEAYNDREHEWKPVRQAMIAAMELVAKKQVTDDMRTERRIRKQISKPLPPRGRGRRAIFKKLNKPVKSYEHTTGTSVTDSTYFDNTYFHKGDIVCLIQDICGPRYPNLDSHRFFQINGFLKVPSMDDCVSLRLLERIVPVPELKYRPDPPPAPADEDEAKEDIDVVDEDDEFPYRFTLMDYRPANSSEIMVVMSQIKFVMRCPPDFYCGHDIIYFKPIPGRIYTRLGRDVYEYDEDTVSERNRRRTSSSDNENDESSSSPPSIINNNTNNSRGDDNESVSSSSNSNNSNINSHSNGGESSKNCNLAPAISI